MPEFWTSCGYRLLKADSDGRLVVTEEFLQSFLLRPELVPVLESCAAERALHDRLLAQPRADVTETDLSAITDPDAQASGDRSAERPVRKDRALCRSAISHGVRAVSLSGGRCGLSHDP